MLNQPDKASSGCAPQPLPRCSLLLVTTAAAELPLTAPDPPTKSWSLSCRVSLLYLGHKAPPQDRTCCLPSYGMCLACTYLYSLANCAWVSCVVEELLESKSFYLSLAADKLHPKTWAESSQDTGNESPLTLLSHHRST